QERMVGAELDKPIHGFGSTYQAMRRAGWLPKKGRKYNARSSARSLSSQPVGMICTVPIPLTARPSFVSKIVCSALVLAFCASGQVDAAGVGAEAKEAELKQVRGRIESIRKAIHNDAERRDSLTAQLKAAELEIQTAREQLTEVRTRRVAAETRLKELQSERGLTERQISAQRDALAGELKVAYMNGREEQLKLMLNQRDPAQAARTMAYYGYLSRARSERINAINEHLAHLDLLSEKITAEAERLKAIEVDNAREVRALAGARDRRAQTLTQIQSKLNNRTEELAKLERDAKSLEKLVEELRRAIDEFPDLADTPFARVRSKLPWPVKGPVLARFGQLRAGGPLKWQGMLIGAARGTQVRAPYQGRVVYADWLPGLGLLIVLDHGGGYMSLYGHNEQLYRRVGERVSAGAALAAVGDAAGVGKPALYFEIRRGRQAVDPVPWLAKP
ncbi:MAG TPA: peptidoglycan DD-metalloendopeptidase family protein, partial [Steroidobacteraceae bacterium]|nr:peptidoglycan DD-metalloendopeptidase family protein [Steroidobacteraceae bacterium]